MREGGVMNNARFMGRKASLMIMALLMGGWMLTGTASATVAELRVANEIAPPGGLALIRIELTEPKPISGGQIRLSFSDASLASTAIFQAGIRRAAVRSPLGPILAVGLMSRSGDVTGSSSQDAGGLTVGFTSPLATFGNDLDLPVLVIAMQVNADALAGDRVSLILDPAGTQFTDPSGVPYTVVVKPGIFTVGGTSITSVTAPGSFIPAGTTFTFQGVGFQPGVRIDIENANLSQVRFVSSQAIEITNQTAFRLGPTRVRLRNPDGSSDDFYGIPELIQSSAGPSTTPRFAVSSMSFLKDKPENLVLNFSSALAADTTVTLVNSNGEALQVPSSLRVAAGAIQVTFQAFGLAAGSGSLTAFLANASSSLPYLVMEGSILRIPVLRYDALSKVGLALANAGSATAQIQLRGFSEDSTVGSAPLTPAVSIFLNLGPLQQVSRFLEEYDPHFLGFRGWVEVSSQSRDIHALFLNMPSDRLAFAGSSGQGPSAMELVFPQSNLDAAGNFEFSLLNDNFSQAALTLDLINSSGVKLRSLGRQLQPQEFFSSSLAGLFPDLAGILPDCYLHVTASQPLVAYQQAFNAQTIFARAPMVVPTGAGALFLPQFVTGSSWFTELTLINSFGAPGRAVVSFLDDRGDLISQGVQSNPVAVDIPAGGQVILDGGNLFGAAPGLFLGGALSIQTSIGISGAAVVGASTGKQVLTGMPMMASGSTEAVFPHLATGVGGGVGYFTGLAFQNMDSATTAIQIQLRSADGSSTRETTLSLPPGGRLAALLSEIFPGLPPQLGGQIRVVSSRPIGMVEAFGNERLDFMITVPASVVR